ncbi:MAG: hypothetical protein J3R72DRAFT_129314 [Linnemannia gamsii]|nr:MAG: hypothetical protein J3R72DRAFT_129314 [Linnemannia gamsii]
MHDFQVLRDYPLIMAIDFGMKETRVAFAYGLHDKEVIDITSWPRDSRRIAAMSVSLYKKDSTEIIDWGYKAHVEKMKPTGSQYCLLSNLKLHLHGTKELPPLDIPITLLQAIADYLRMVHEYAVREALRYVADHFQSNFQLNNFHFRYCLTVPARWSDRAKETMRQAAIVAGLVEASDPPQRLMLISEDEAKALYCLRRMDQFEFKDKDRFLICDTNEDHEGVDLVVFEVSEPSAGQAQRLKEVARSHGAVCASTVLDSRMRELLEDKLRSHLPNLPANVIGELMEIFRDAVKLGFDGSEDQFIQFPYVLELDDEEEDTGVDDGYLIFTASDLKEKVFEPVVKIVLELIRVMLLQQERLGGNCEAIFMFGEFGSSTYLYKRVGQEFQGQLGLISIPPRQELGTVRGAVFAGLNPNAVAGFHPKPKGEQSNHRALPSIPVSISPMPTPSSTTPLQTIGSVHSVPHLSVNNYAHQDKDRRQNVGHHQQHQQPSTTLGYVPPPPPPALTGRGAGNYQQTLRAPQSRTFPTSALVSTPATQANGLAPNSHQVVMAFDLGNAIFFASDQFLRSLLHID